MGRLKCIHFQPSRQGDQIVPHNIFVGHCWKIRKLLIGGHYPNYYLSGPSPQRKEVLLSFSLRPSSDGEGTGGIIVYCENNVWFYQSAPSRLICRHTESLAHCAKDSVIKKGGRWSATVAAVRTVAGECNCVWCGPRRYALHQRGIHCATRKSLLRAVS